MISCPYCEQENPAVSVTRDVALTIAGENEVSSLAQKAAVEVECHHCQGRFVVQFELQPAGIMIDLS